MPRVALAREILAAGASCSSGQQLSDALHVLFVVLFFLVLFVVFFFFFFFFFVVVVVVVFALFFVRFVVVRRRGRRCAAKSAIGFATSDKTYVRSPSIQAM